MEESARRCRYARTPVLVLAAVYGLLLLGLGATIVFPTSDPPLRGSGVTTTAPPEPAVASPDTRAEDHSGEDDRGEDDHGEAERATPPTTHLLGDLDQVRLLIAEGFESDYAPHITRSEAECMARVVVDVLGPDRLHELTEVMIAGATDPTSFDPADPRLPTSEENRQLDEQMRPCVDAETAARMDL